MSGEKITTTSLEVIETYNTETGLVVYAVSLDDLDKAINAMDKQAKRINEEKDALTIERDKLQTQVERLTKAGDDLVFHIGNSDKALYQCADAWRAAKEVQS
jgi:uncharacterized protein (DUF3084 family)